MRKPWECPDACHTLRRLSEPRRKLRKNPWWTGLSPNLVQNTAEKHEWDRVKDLKAITQKTLIATGEFDEITLDCHETIRDCIAGNARLAVMPGCSHMTMVEKPEEYNALVRRFLREA